MESKQVWEKEEEEFGEAGICPCVLDFSTFGSQTMATENVQKVCESWTNCGY